MARQSRVQSGKKGGKLTHSKSFNAIEIKQGKATLYSFSAKASDLWEFVSINRREENKDAGYQRVLSNSRVRAVADYIEAGHVIPGSIIIAIDDGKYEASKGRLRVQSGKDVAWVIDGQHRLAGAHLASQNGTDIDLGVVALLDLNEQAQIEQFVTINREAKNVPTSLYLDLLKRLPKNKSPAEQAAERAADIANELRKSKESAFYGRVVVTMSPAKGQISIVNFVRKVSPYVNPEKGLLNKYTLEEQRAILDNYFHGIRQSYQEEWKKVDPIFFKTIGFGALMNVFDDVFKECSKSGSFRVTDIVDVLKPMQAFDFAQWSSLGSGNKAEVEAAKDFQIDFARNLEKVRAKGDSRQLKL
jgi:DGQHR domain-containing protein